MGTRQEQFSGTREVREAHQFEIAQLEEYMLSHVEHFQGPLSARQFKGGQSNPTYLLESPSGKYVMRRKPPGKLLKSAHAVDREFKVISALYAADLPVPRPHVLCKDEEIVGTMFFIMEFVEGRIFWELDLPGVDQKERTAIYDHLGKTIAELHNFDHEKIGLGDYGKPGNYFARQISRWSKQYQASETEKVVLMDKLIAWLPDNIPEDESASVVHGDYRLDNVIIHPTEPKVIAVLDWELSTIGHPLGDFTYHLMGWQMPEIGVGSSGLLGKDLQVLGIPTEEEYVAAYCERTGRPDGILNRDFYAAYNFFRIAAILQGIAGRVRDGTAASAHAERGDKAVPILADMAWEYAQKAGAA
jgi:aminoglycoside phosphotransferase (APT) family kinase protein